MISSDTTRSASLAETVGKSVSLASSVRKNKSWPRTITVKSAVSVLLLALAILSGCRLEPAWAEETSDTSRSTPLVIETRIDGDTISGVTVRHVDRAIRYAEEKNAQCLIISLDTPGGLVSATREIVKSILASRVPVVIHVAPTGAQAASAGGFITLAAHVAAMSPATTIGAMHPVAVGGLPIPSPNDSPGKLPTADNEEDDGKVERKPALPVSAMEEKVVNNTAAWARGLAMLRGRNGDWAERAVNDSIVATETEALEAGIIDFLAAGRDELLEKLDGREVTLADRTVTLNTVNASVEPFEMWWGDEVLSALANPNVSFLLLIFGFYGILFELYSPGWGVGGTLGIVCLVLAFFGLSVLPINYVGLLLIAAALALFVAEAFVTSYGSLAIGGCVCLVIGGLMLVDSPVGFARVSMSVILPIAAATSCIVVLLVVAILKAHRGKALTGSEGMIGECAASVAAFGEQNGQFVGTVRVHGEFWNATCPESVDSDTAVEIESRDGLVLRVRPVARTEAASSTTSVTHE